MNTDGLKQLWKIVFGDPDSFIDSFFSVAFAPERCQYWETDGRIVSALYWLDCSYPGGKLAYIYAVATHPDYRGQGLASRLLRQTHARLQALGYAGAVLKPAKGLFPFYERLGYATSGFVSRFEAEAASESIPLRRLSPAEHGALRKAMLPEGSVVQEGVTLQFLHQFAGAWASGGALICAEPSEGIVMEFLGDRSKAPGMLAALGIPRATLPTPGPNVPFTMFYPINCTKIPGYLGITLE